MINEPIQPTGPTPPAEAAPIALVQPAADIVEEQALISALRMLNRTANRIAVSSVERAVLMGAQAIFDQLAIACEELLESVESEKDMAASMAEDEPLTSSGPAKRKKSSRRRR